MKATATNVSIRRNRSIRVATAVVCAVALTTLAGCSAGGDTAPSTNTSTGGSGDEYVAQSKELIDLVSTAAVTGPSVGIVDIADIVPWDAAEMPVPNALPAKPIKVAVVSSFSVGYPLYAMNLIEAVGEELGWEVNLFQAASSTPQDALTAMRQAILEKPDAIIAPVIPAVWIAQALDEAREQGIKTVAIQKDSSSGEGFDAYVPVAEGVQKAIIAASIVAESNGEANTLMINVPGFGDANVPAAYEFLQECSGCTTEMTEFTIDVMIDQAKLQANVGAALASGDIDYLIWPQGSAPLAGPINAIATSPNKETKLLVNNPGPPAIQSLIDGDLPRTVEAPMALATLIAIDQASRLVQGKKALAEDELRYPISFWTTDSSPEASYNSMTVAQLKANDWLSPYNKAWNVSLDRIMKTVNE